MNLFEIARLREPKYPPFYVGIEVEAEGRNLPTPDDLAETSWKWHKDGSLRGESAEYILHKPLSIPDAKKQIDALIAISKNKKTQYTFSNRTSVHVHLNVMPHSLVELANLVCIYYMFEEILLRYCGEDRHQNRFCLSARDAEGLIRLICNNLNPRFLFSINEEKAKYSALNIAPIGRQGSIEFRGMRGTLDKEILHPWLDVIFNIAHLSTTIKSPSKLLEIPLYKLADKIFKEHAPLFLFEGWEDQVRYNISICAELFYTLDELKKEKPVAKKLPQNKMDAKGVFDELLAVHVRGNGGAIVFRELDIDQ